MLSDVSWTFGGGTSRRHGYKLPLLQACRRQRQCLVFQRGCAGTGKFFVPLEMSFVGSEMALRQSVQGQIAPSGRHLRHERCRRRPKCGPGRIALWSRRKPACPAYGRPTSCACGSGRRCRLWPAAAAGIGRGSYADDVWSDEDCGDNVDNSGPKQPAFRIAPRQTNHSLIGRMFVRLGCQGQRNRVQGGEDLVRGYGDEQGT